MNTMARWAREIYKGSCVHRVHRAGRRHVLRGTHGRRDEIPASLVPSVTSSVTCRSRTASGLPRRWPRPRPRVRRPVNAAGDRAVGFAMFFPANFGAEQQTGSNIEVLPGCRLPGSRTRPPWNVAPRSVMMSPVCWWQSSNWPGSSTISRARQCSSASQRSDTAARVDGRRAADAWPSVVTCSCPPCRPSSGRATARTEGVADDPVHALVGVQLF